MDLYSPTPFPHSLLRTGESSAGSSLSLGFRVSGFGFQDYCRAWIVEVHRNSRDSHESFPRVARLQGLHNPKGPSTQ